MVDMLLLVPNAMYAEQLRYLQRGSGCIEYISSFLDSSGSAADTVARVYYRCVQ